MSYLIVREDSGDDRRLVLEVMGRPHADFSRGDLGGLAAAVKLFFEQDRSSIVRIEADSDIKPEIALALFRAGVLGPS